MMMKSATGNNIFLRKRFNIATDALKKIAMLIMKENSLAFFCEKCLLAKMHGVIKNDNVVNAALFGAFAFVMYDACFGVVVVFVTSLCYAVRHINILAVHKKCFIQ